MRNEFNGKTYIFNFSQLIKINQSINVDSLFTFKSRGVNNITHRYLLSPENYIPTTNIVIKNNNFKHWKKKWFHSPS